MHPAAVRCLRWCFRVWAQLHEAAHAERARTVNPAAKFVLRIAIRDCRGHLGGGALLTL